MSYEVKIGSHILEVIGVEDAYINVVGETTLIQKYSSKNPNGDILFATSTSLTFNQLPIKLKGVFSMYNRPRWKVKWKTLITWAKCYNLPFVKLYSGWHYLKLNKGLTWTKQVHIPVINSTSLTNKSLKIVFDHKPWESGKYLNDDYLWVRTGEHIMCFDKVYKRLLFNNQLIDLARLQKEFKRKVKWSVFAKYCLEETKRLRQVAFTVGDTQVSLSVLPISSVIQTRDYCIIERNKQRLIQQGDALYFNDVAFDLSLYIDNYKSPLFSRRNRLSGTWELFSTLIQKQHEDVAKEVRELNPGVNRTASEETASERAASERAASERAASERAASERAESEETAREETASEETASEEISEKEASREEPCKELTHITCVVCMDAQSNTIFIPCYHIATCAQCAKKLTSCPVCRERIVESKQVYIVVSD